jgi:hypothetical protein
LVQSIHQRGIHGEGQVIAVLDTGLDYRSCYFAEPDGSAPPINTSLSGNNVDPSRRKVIAYNFLYSCAEFPGARGCDDPQNPAHYDNQGHGTHAAAAAAGDSGTPIARDYADGVAPGAKLVIQDGGYVEPPVESCTLRPGFGCPPRMTPILEQAWRQGARIHSNSWGDAQSPRGGYSQVTHDVDAFVYAHPEMLVVFNTGNFQNTSTPPPTSLSAPGAAKNTIQVGGTRGFLGRGDDVLAGYTLRGPTVDGRIKPDVVGPAYVLAGDAGLECGATLQPGTSWASPTIAGFAALVRQYYTAGFYGAPFTPSAALLKATIIAAARPVLMRTNGLNDSVADPAPSFEQGYGLPILEDALYFTGDRARLRVIDVPNESGLAQGENTTIGVAANAGTRLKATLVWTDPPGPQLVNDLDLLVTGPSGALPAQPDRINNVEVVAIDASAAGTYTIAVAGTRVGARQGYALVITGDLDESPARRRAVRR